MTRRQWLSTAFGGAAAFGAAPNRPNFIFILSDDHHYQCLGAAGNPRIRTPNLDRLAARGTLFTNGIISTSQCAPSRGILLSGLETFQSGLRSNGATSFREGFGPTVVEQMRRAGYDTAVIGKWHIQSQPRACGFARAPLWLVQGSSRYLDPVLRKELDGPPEKRPGHITDLFTGAAISYVRSAVKPFFLWLSYNAPHSPWHADEKYKRHYEGRDAAQLAPPHHPKDGKPFNWATYYAVITHLDEAIGRLVSAVEDAGMWNNTVIVFLGDNGYLCGTKGLSGKVYPWEESVRVPFLAAGGPVQRGARLDNPVASVDLPATWLDMAGIRPAGKLAGRSLKQLLQTGKGGPDEAFSVWDDGRPEGLTTGKAVEPYRLVRNRTHKLIVWESRKQALYHHVEDPAEEHNLIDNPKHTAVLQQLKQRLAARMKATHDRAASWLA